VGFHSAEVQNTTMLDSSSNFHMKLQCMAVEFSHISVMKFSHKQRNCTS